MSDDRGTADDSGDREDSADAGDRESPDEPLGGVAEKVRERTGDPREAADRDSTPRDGPLADVATQVDERRRQTRDGADAFESVEVGELDGEKLWKRLADEDGDGPSVTVPAGESVEVEDDVWGDDRDVRTIPKETCRGCPHFGDPPELACTNEGTAILAMTDVDHFRVADCPMVVEEEEIGGITVDPDDADAGGDGDQHDPATRGEVADQRDSADEPRSDADGIQGGADEVQNSADGT